MSRIEAQQTRHSLSRRTMLKYSLACPAIAKTLASASAVGALTAANLLPASAQGQEVVVGIFDAPGTLDARRVRATPEQQAFFALYDGLVDFDVNAKIRPRLAESFERVDETSWRFKLRQGVTFHDGEEFSAETVAFTFDQLKSLDPPFYYINWWGPAWPPEVEVEATDSVLITTPNPSPLLPNLLTRIGMLPSAATDEGYGEQPIGTGPFKFAEWIKGDRLTLEANADYWDGAPPISRLVFRAIPEPSSQLAALQSGEIHLAYDPPVDRLDELDSAPLQRLESVSTGLAQVLINRRNPDSPVADLRVRQALRLAIDGEGMIQALLPGVAVPSIGPAPATTFGALDVGGYPARDVEAARALLAEAGYGDGVDLTMIFTAGEFPRDTAIAEALISQFSEIGANVEFIELDGGQYSERRRTADWDLATNGTTGWTGDAEYYVNDVKTTMGLELAELDDLVRQGAAAESEEERVELLQQAQQILWDDVPYVWTFDVVLVMGATSNLSGVELIPTAWALYRDASLGS